MQPRVVEVELIDAHIIHEEDEEVGAGREGPRRGDGKHRGGREAVWGYGGGVHNCNPISYYSYSHVNRYSYQRERTPATASDIANMVIGDLKVYVLP